MVVGVAASGVLLSVSMIIMGVVMMECCRKNKGKHIRFGVGARARARARLRDSVRVLVRVRERVGVRGWDWVGSRASFVTNPNPKR